MEPKAMCNLNKQEDPKLRRRMDTLIKLLDEHSEISCSIEIKLSQITSDEQIKDPNSAKTAREPHTFTDELDYAIDRFGYVNSVNRANLLLLNKLIQNNFKLSIGVALR